MPIYAASVTGPTQYDGATAATGLFAHAVTDPSVRVKVNSINFGDATSTTSWTLSLIDPGDGQSTVVLEKPVGAPTDTDFSLGGPDGFMLLPTNADGQPWQLALVTVGMVGTGKFKIDYDLDRSQQRAGG